MTKEGKDSASLDPEENRVTREWKDHLDIWVPKEKWDAKENRVQRDPLVKKVILEQKVSQEPEGPQETQVCRVLTDLQEILA